MPAVPGSRAPAPTAIAAVCTPGFQRTSPYPMLMTFDAPDSNVCCVRRERSKDALQALTLLNDTVFVECAQTFGKRIIEEKPGDAKERIRYAFRLCVARRTDAGGAGTAHHAA